MKKTLLIIIMCLFTVGTINCNYNNYELTAKPIESRSLRDITTNSMGDKTIRFVHVSVNAAEYDLNHSNWIGLGFSITEILDLTNKINDLIPRVETNESMIGVTNCINRLHLPKFLLKLVAVGYYVNLSNSTFKTVYNSLQSPSSTNSKPSKSATLKLSGNNSENSYTKVADTNSKQENAIDKLPTQVEFEERVYTMLDMLPEESRHEINLWYAKTLACIQGTSVKTSTLPTFPIWVLVEAENEIKSEVISSFMGNPGDNITNFTSGKKRANIYMIINFVNSLNVLKNDLSGA